MLRVSLAEVKPILSKNATIEMSKSMPAMVLIGSTLVALPADTKTESKKYYEPCSDYCCEIVG